MRRIDQETDLWQPAGAQLADQLASQGDDESSLSAVSSSTRDAIHYDVSSKFWWGSSTSEHCDRVAQKSGALRERLCA
jgi:hypothetical protein